MATADQPGTGSDDLEHAGAQPAAWEQRTRELLAQTRSAFEAELRSGEEVRICAMASFAGVPVILALTTEQLIALNNKKPKKVKPKGLLFKGPFAAFEVVRSAPQEAAETQYLPDGRIVRGEPMWVVELDIGPSSEPGKGFRGKSAELSWASKGGLEKVLRNALMSSGGKTKIEDLTMPLAFRHPWFDEGQLIGASLPRAGE
jgi:hypothetical protein